jgi:hemerythrin-like domain-containing protein
MRLLDELRAEHDLIEKVLGSLRSYVEARLQGAFDPVDTEEFLRFFRVFAGGYHHAREEDCLFPALVEAAELPLGAGPVQVLIAQHEAMGRVLAELAPLLRTYPLQLGARSRLERLATRYSHALWAHIDAENTVLLPEAEKRLRRVSMLEIDSRPPTAEEEAAKACGELLVERYPPTMDPDALRGEGCVVCPSFGIDCQGIEHEWWNESEWEEFPDHL